MPSKGIKRRLLYFSFPRTSKSSTKIKPPKCIGQCNHIRAKPKLVLQHKRLVNDVFGQPEETDLAEPVSLENGTVSKRGCTSFSSESYMLPTLWSYIDLSLDLSNLILPLPASTKVIVFINVTQLTSARFEDVCRCQSTSLLLSPLNLNEQDGQLVDNAKRHLLISQGEEVPDDAHCIPPLNLSLILLLSDL
ncbi:hypothetical protein ACTXT7_008172 [Hymenolepis weldensis]